MFNEGAYETQAPTEPLRYKVEGSWPWNKRIVKGKRNTGINWATCLRDGVSIQHVVDELNDLYDDACYGLGDSTVYTSFPIEYTRAIKEGFVEAQTKGITSYKLAYEDIVTFYNHYDPKLGTKCLDENRINTIRMRWLAQKGGSKFYRIDTGRRLSGDEYVDHLDKVILAYINDLQAMVNLTY